MVERVALEIGNDSFLFSPEVNQFKELVYFCHIKIVLRSEEVRMIKVGTYLYIYTISCSFVSAIKNIRQSIRAKNVTLVNYAAPTFYLLVLNVKSIII